MLFQNTIGEKDTVEVIVFVLNPGGGFVFQFAVTFFQSIANGSEIVDFDGVEAINKTPKMRNRETTLEPTTSGTAVNVGKHGFGEVG